MMAIGKKLPDEGAGEIEALLPWHAAGTLNARDGRLVDEALARNPELARQFAEIREEHAEVVLLNESLGAPSARTIRKLFAENIEANSVHGSDSAENAAAEIAFFFAGIEIVG